MSGKLSVSSELMKNQKQAEVMSPSSDFKVLQTHEGHALFFSIGEDDVLYLSREVMEHQTGWDRKDLSSALASNHDQKQVVAKHFDLAQNLSTGLIDLALVIRVDDQDFLYLSRNNSNSDLSWSENIEWTAMPFDDPDHSFSPLQIVNVYIAQTAQDEYFVVDVLKEPGSTLNFVFRYYIDPAKRMADRIWNAHDLTGNLNADELTSCLGRRAKDEVDGVYTLGKIATTTELLYTPLYNVFDPILAPNAARLQVPEGGSSIAVTEATDGTNLYVAGSNALYFFASDQQQDGQAGVKILDSDLFVGVRSLYASSTEKEVVIWGLNQQSEIFYTKCARGKETESSAWSFPVPLLTGVEQVAPYLNAQGGHLVIFAHISGRDIMQLTQDPATTHWQQRPILLPSTQTGNVIEYKTYTTHLQVTQEDNLPWRDGGHVLVSATGHCSVFINNTYYILSPDVDIKVALDETGAVTIIQQTNSIGAKSYHIKLDGTDTKVDVNPLSKVMETVEQVKTGDDLGKIQISNEDGSKKPLVGSNITSEQKELTAKALQQFTKIAGDMPSDGSIRSAAARNAAAQPFTATSDTVWGISYDDAEWQYHEGQAAIDHFGLQVSRGSSEVVRAAATDQDTTLGDLGNAIEMTAGDMFNWLKHAYADVKRQFIELIDDVYHFFLEIGGKVFRCILNCIEDVVNAIEFVINKIAVFLDDLVKWLGFLFEWDDIIRTHNVFKNIIKRYTENVVNQIGNYKKEANQIFTDVEKRINQWAELETVTGSLSDKSSGTDSLPGQNSPQANWGNHHYKNGISSATASSDVKPGITDELEALLNTLVNAVETEGEIFEKAVQVIQNDIIDQIDTLPVGDLIKRLLAVFADILIESVENIVDTTLDVIVILIKGVLDILDATIEIPVISWLYKEVTGNDLSLLDLGCLLAAIPSTVIYKALKNETPFPDEPFTKALIEAATWEELRQLYQSPDALTKDMSARGVADDVALNGRDKVQKIVIVMFRFAAAIGTPFFIFTSTVKYQLEEGAENEVESILQLISFYIVTGSNIGASLVASTEQPWYKVVGETVYGITCAQKFMDLAVNKTPIQDKWEKVTGPLDAVLGVAGMISPAFSLVDKQDAKTITGALTNTCWNVNRMLTPGSKDKRVFAAKMALVGLYAIGQTVLILEEGVS